MKRLVDHPVIFVHYPVGAGGWFLTSLIYHAFDQSDPFEFDQLGSGHGNRAIQYINNFYKDFQQSQEGIWILNETNYEFFSKEQRIEYLQNSLLISPLANNSAPQVISLHCKNINIFLEAFPTSKCVQINVSNDDINRCLYNYLHKILSVTPINFETFCKDKGLSDTEFETAKIKIQNLKENFSYFSWVRPFIENTVKSVENFSSFDDRIFEIFYQEYMEDDPNHILKSIFNFLNYTIDNEMIDKLSGFMLTYRSLQPKI
jgi:hypothetical protein